jgi:hypothetical protein
MVMPMAEKRYAKVKRPDPQAEGEGRRRSESS